MSSNNVVFNNGQQATILTDLTKLFIWNNKYGKRPFNNSAYTDLVLKAGTLMGTVASTGYIIPLKSTASDGSQFPTGILAEDITLEGGETKDLSLCIGGDVDENGIILATGDTLDTTISSRRLRDRICGDTLGINLIPTTDNSKYDNY